jgi:hypothetical protein
MSLWGKTDASSNVVAFGPSLVNKTPNTVNRAALFGNTTANAVVNGATIGIFGVAAGEKRGGVKSVTISNTGSGATARPTLTFSAPETTGGTTATATATAKVVSFTVANAGSDAAPTNVLSANNSGATATANVTVTVLTTKVTTAAINASGTGYTNDDVVTIQGGTGTSATILIDETDGNGNVVTISIANGGSYTANPTPLANNTPTGGTGTGLTLLITTGINTANLSNAGVYTALPTNPVANVLVDGTGNTGVRLNLSWGVGTVTITNNGIGYTKAPTITPGGAGLTGALLVAVMEEAIGVAHAGWNKRTVGQGGRAGRVHYECLVAMGSMTSDASDDTILPE